MNVLTHTSRKHYRKSHKEQERFVVDGKHDKAVADELCSKVHMSKEVKLNCENQPLRLRRSARNKFSTIKRRGSLKSVRNLDIANIKQQFSKRKRSVVDSSVSQQSETKHKISKRKRSTVDSSASQQSEIKEPSAKKVCSSTVMTALSNFSPAPVKKIGSSLQRSASLRGTNLSDSDYSKKYKLLPTPTKRRQSKLWCDTVSKRNGNVHERLSPIELKRQEAIFELYSGEEDVVADLKMIQEVYYNPMFKLRLMSEEELQQIFGCLQTLLNLHQDIIGRLSCARSSDGTTESIGDIMIDWFMGLKCYGTYCANQFEAKALLDQKLKDDESVADFLQRCQQSPFSRKLDLWSFLDSPRSRLVKYPLMLKNIEKLTPKDHPDRQRLHLAARRLEEIIEEIDAKTGEAKLVNRKRSKSSSLKCQFVLSRIIFLDDRQMCPMLSESKVLLCNGILKNKQGAKLQAYLFDKVFVLTRPATRDGRSCYQVFAQPILVNDMLVEDLQDGDIRMGGSFKTAISRLANTKNIFRISTLDPRNGQSHTLQAQDEHDKKQWLQNLRSVVPDTENFKSYI